MDGQHKDGLFHIHQIQTSVLISTTSINKNPNGVIDVTANSTIRLFNIIDSKSKDSLKKWIESQNFLSSESNDNRRN